MYVARHIWSILHKVRAKQVYKSVGILNRSTSKNIKNATLGVQTDGDSLPAKVGRGIKTSSHRVPVVFFWRVVSAIRLKNRLSVS